MTSEAFFAVAEAHWTSFLSSCALVFCIKWADYTLQQLPQDLPITLDFFMAAFFSPSFPLPPRRALQICAIQWESRWGIIEVMLYGFTERLFCPISPK